MRTYSYNLASSAIVAASGILATTAHQIEYSTGYAVQAVYSGASIRAKLSLEASNDGDTFVTIPASTAYIDGSGSYLRNVLASNYEFVRFIYEASSASASSATVNVVLQSKGF